MEFRKPISKFLAIVMPKLVLRAAGLRLARAAQERCAQERWVPKRRIQKRRAWKRPRTCLLGSLHTAVVTRADNLCDVVDLSAGGARVRLVDPMARFSRITLGLRHFGYFRARVVWRDGDEVGLAFEADPRSVVARMRGLLPQAAAAGTSGTY